MCTEAKRLRRKKNRAKKRCLESLNYDYGSKDPTSYEAIRNILRSNFNAK